LFSRDICPACGQTSAPAERTEPTEIQRRLDDPHTPSYTGPFDEAMTEAEKRGRIELSLVSAVFLVPDGVRTVVGILLLRPEFLPGLRLVLAWLLVRALWQGRTWARRLAGVLALAIGLGLVAFALGRHARLTPVELLFFWGTGVPILLTALPLWRSTDLTDYLRRRREQPPPV
jgi:hypothetical protein